MKNASTDDGISTVPLRILLRIWMRQLCFLEGFAEVQEMTCIERSGSSHRTLVLAAGDVETIRIWSTYPLKYSPRGEDTLSQQLENSNSPRDHSGCLPQLKGLSFPLPSLWLENSGLA